MSNSSSSRSGSTKNNKDAANSTIIVDDIGIIAPYWKQVRKIRDALRLKDYGNVRVGLQLLEEAMSKTSSTSSGETKQDDTSLHFLGSVLIPSATTKEELISTDLVRWTAIFSYLHFNEHERLSVNNFKHLFKGNRKKTKDI